MVVAGALGVPSAHCTQAHLVHMAHLLHPLVLVMGQPPKNPSHSHPIADVQARAVAPNCPNLMVGAAVVVPLGVQVVKTQRLHMDFLVQALLVSQKRQ